MLGAWKVSFILIISVDKGIITEHIKRLAWTQDYEVGMYNNRSFTIYIITDITVTCQYFFLSIAVDWTSNYRGRCVCVIGLYSN